MSASLHLFTPLDLREVLALAPGPTGGLHFALADQRYRLAALGPYLMRSLPRSQASGVWTNHYRTLLTRFEVEGVYDLVLRGFDLWSDHDRRNRIGLKTERVDSAEGELTASYYREGLRLYTMSFTLAPGEAVGSADAEVALLTRVQGEPNRLAEVKAAASELGGVAPPFALIASIDGFCDALGVRRLLGCSGTDQVKFTAPLAQSFFRNYDDFFRSLGGVEDERGRFEINLPIGARPLSHVKRGHRSRAKARRRVREDIAVRAFEEATARMRLSSGQAGARESS